MSQIVRTEKRNTIVIVNAAVCMCVFFFPLNGHIYDFRVHGIHTQHGTTQHTTQPSQAQCICIFPHQLIVASGMYLIIVYFEKLNKSKCHLVALL